MFILQASNIKKQFSAKTILDFPSLTIYSGDKIGIVGDNGSGKTTLLKILSGNLKPDQGTVNLHRQGVYLEQLSDSYTTLSGGEEQKQKILKIVKNPSLVLFGDEPTANLDLAGVDWLTATLSKVETSLIVSHNRSLLEAVCNKIIEVSGGTIKEYAVGYKDYLQLKTEEKARQIEEYDSYRIKQKQLTQAVEKKTQQVTRLKGNFKRDKITNNSQARLAMDKRNALFKKIEKERKVLQTRKDSMDAVSRPKELANIKLDFSLTNPPENKRIITADSINFAYGNHKIFTNANFTWYGGEKLAITGENGSGKSTLIKLLPTFNNVPKLKIGYLLQDFSQISLSHTLLENALKSNIQTMDKVYNLLARLLFTGEDLDKKAEILSGGERTRLLLAMIILSNANALVLDEPTNFLDISSLEVLEETLVEYPGSVLFISHDSRFTDKIVTRKLAIKDKKLVVPPETKTKSDTHRILLELRRDQLVQKLSTSGESERLKLEQEYQGVISLLKLG